MPEWIDHPAPWVIAGITLIVVVAKISMWAGAVNTDRTSFTDFMKEIRAKVDMILERLPPPGVATAASPLRLTDLGQKISTEIGATELARELAVEIRERVAGMDEYDLQETCLDFLENDYEPTPEMDSLIKKAAFDNGLKRHQVLRVIGLELRDLLSTRSSE